jgi:eukaryotic-like serine/threonine-protein kinase
MSGIPASLRIALADRYPLERVIGEGGMATVYLARDLKHGRAVAVKVLRPEVGVLLGRERFEREIRRTAQLNHPQIIPVFDSGESAGYLYYVMPVVEGESLKDRLAREHRLALEETLRLVEQIAAALGHAHERGLIHRDIKPANVMLSGGRAIVTDFGIARAASDLEESRLTETGLSVGTPAYMSPEQAVGQRDVDPRSDQYSLACVVYEMLGGDPPFTGSTPQAVLARQITDLPPALRTVRPDLPPAMESVLFKALSKTPGDRYESIAAFAAAVRESVGREASSGTFSPIRRRLPVAMTGVGLLLVLGTAAWAVARAWKPESGVIRSIAVLPPENLTGDTASGYLVQGIQEGLITELGQLREVRVKPRSAVLSFWDERRLMPRVVDGLAVDGLVELAILPSADSLRITAKLIRGSTLDVIWARTYSGARADILRTLAEAARAVAREAGLAVPAAGASTRLVAVRQVDPEVYELVVRARAAERWTKEGQTRALQLLNRARSLDPLHAPIYAELSKVLRTQLLLGYVSPEEYRAQVLEAARRAVQLDSLDANNHVALAEAEFWINWDWVAAERAYTRANELNPSLAGNSFEHSSFLTLTGRFDEGLAEIERVLRNDPLNSEARLQVAWTTFNARRFPEALALLRGHNGKASLQQMAWAYSALDSTDQALVTVARMLVDTTEPNDEFYLTTAASVNARAGRRREAHRLLDSTLVWARREQRAIDPYMVAEVYAAMGDELEAIRWLERVLKERWPSMMFAAVEPWISDRLRSSSRVREIFRAAGLPEWAGQPFKADRRP